MPLAELAATHDPRARLAALRLGGEGAAALLSPLVAVCVLSSLQATVLVGPRIYQAMAVDGLFFPAVGRAHASTGAPVVGLVAQALIAIAELLTGSFDQLLTFAMFSIVAFSTLAVARGRRPARATSRRGAALPRAGRTRASRSLFVVVNAWVLWSVLSGPCLYDALVGLAIVATGVPAYWRSAFARGAPAPRAAGQAEESSR